MADVSLLPTLVDEGLEGIGRFYSVYRAMVVQNVDPDSMNRLKLFIPGIFGGMFLWALPRGQHGSSNTGFKYLAPSIGDIVFVTFENGDPSKPLWEYHGWGSDQIPPEFDSPDVCGFITPNGTEILFDDSEGTLDLYLPGDANIFSEGNVYVNGKKVVVNSGENGGVIKIQELTDKLNNLVSELEKLKLDYQNHTHIGVLTGPGVTGVPTVPYTSPFSTFNKTDYEDDNFTH
jgi:hypothetical protein